MRRLVILALLAASCSGKKAAPEPAVDPGVAACEAFHARLVACEDDIVDAVGARKPGADLNGLRAKLTAPMSCAGAKLDKQTRAAACGSDDCAAMAACMADVLAPGPAVPKVAATAPNVLFIMVDTVRADRLGVTGYRRNGVSITPRLDAFAAQGVRFTRTYAQGANTPRSLPSMWTSRYPSQIPFVDVFHNFPPVNDDASFLFESLRDGGLRTTGFSSHFYFDRKRNVAQGFAEYDNTGALNVKGSNGDFAAPRIVPRAIARLEALAAAKTQFAMFVHLFEPHSTYLEHDEFPVKLKKTAGLEEKYDYEIAIADRFVGEVLDAVDRLALADHTVVVILSDHGEAFGVHRAPEEGKLFFHGQALYDEVLRAFLLIRAPGVAPAVRDDLVGLIDVAPTILDLVGIPAPPTFVGRSLAPLLRGESLPPRPVGAQLQSTPAWKHDATAFIDGTDKIILHDDGHAEVFDLAADPEERHDLADDKPRTDRLRAALAAWQAQLK